MIMTEPTLPPITEDDIANYLVNTPDFFDRHASVLASVQLSSPHSHRAVSLQERQAELLREKIRGLELKAADMIRHGRDNAAIADRMHRWACAMLRARDTSNLPGLAAREIAAQFAVPQVAIRLWDVAPEVAGHAWAQGASEEVRAFAHSLLRPYCGGNPGLEAAAWLDHPDLVASLALIPLRVEVGQPAFGLLVMGSSDPQRFVAEMGTEFLERLGELTSAALSRLRP
jgi:uncharacterized protein